MQSLVNRDLYSTIDISIGLSLLGVRTKVVLKEELFQVSHTTRWVKIKKKVQFMKLCSYLELGFFARGAAIRYLQEVARGEGGGRLAVFKAICKSNRLISPYLGFAPCLKKFQKNLIK